MSDTIEHEHGKVAGFMCSHVLRKERSVNLICHTADGSISFLCGEDDPDHEDATKISLVCAQCGFADFVDGVELDDLPMNWVAERPVSSERWVLRAMSADELNENE